MERQFSLYFDGILQEEDYQESACPLCLRPGPGKEPASPIPQKRIIEKLDAYMSRRDYAGAERHLLYWLEEAKQQSDERGELLVRNELIGHFRKTGKQKEAMEQIEKALQLIPVLGFEGTVSAATTYVNAATACQAFGDAGRSADLFEQARKIYEERPETRPDLLGGLYNNMGLTLTAMGEYEKALIMYERAMEQMSLADSGKLEQAITCLNMADLAEARDGIETAEKEIYTLVDRAWDLLCSPEIPHDGYYAFVCEKCAPSFSYYGYFAAAEQLTKTADEIYGLTQKTQI